MNMAAALVATRSEEHPRLAQPPPAWIDTLVDVVVGYMEAHSPTIPVAFRYREEDTIGELVVYLTPVELVGGADDGAVVVPGFFLDLQALVAVVDRVTALQWCPHSFGLGAGTE